MADVSKRSIKLYKNVKLLYRFLSLHLSCVSECAKSQHFRERIEREKGTPNEIIPKGSSLSLSLSLSVCWSPFVLSKNVHCSGWVSSLLVSGLTEMLYCNIFFSKNTEPLLDNLFPNISFVFFALCFLLFSHCCSTSRKCWALKEPLLGICWMNKWINVHVFVY